MGPRASQDLRSPSPIMAPAKTYFLKLLIALGDNYNLRKKKKKKIKNASFCRAVILLFFKKHCELKGVLHS